MELKPETIAAIASRLATGTTEDRIRATAKGHTSETVEKYIQAARAELQRQQMQQPDMRADFLATFDALDAQTPAHWITPDVVARTEEWIATLLPDDLLERVNQRLHKLNPKIRKLVRQDVAVIGLFHWRSAIENNSQNHEDGVEGDCPRERVIEFAKTDAEGITTGRYEFKHVQVTLETLTALKFTTKTREKEWSPKKGDSKSERWRIHVPEALKDLFQPPTH